MSREDLNKGDDYTFIIQILDEGMPRSIAGVQDICYEVFESEDERVLLYTACLDDGITVPDLAKGIIYIHFPWEVSENTNKIQLYHKCKIKDQSGRKTTILSDHLDFYNKIF